MADTAVKTETSYVKNQTVKSELRKIRMTKIMLFRIATDAYASEEVNKKTETNTSDNSGKQKV